MTPNICVNTTTTKDISRELYPSWQIIVGLCFFITILTSILWVVFVISFQFLEYLNAQSTKDIQFFITPTGESWYQQSSGINILLGWGAVLLVWLIFFCTIGGIIIQCFQFSWKKNDWGAWLFVVVVVDVILLQSLAYDFVHNLISIVL
jgi:hypothetical protein